ncbi:SDR family oxidoreductase [Actinoplanes sp. NBRC 103695]|uniref:SDR family NAD(P)-dependent oxidoreductase n=1 Tax=Actinoplanes sp. NBRC 103695 TaxID=3032202 RepID=UPI0024A53647|nr:SDR family oxidoreductase [Actinoplanes sp. NBRC 103695]GLY98608.1 diacetyl reductase [Actinoplanes sp. NBRC 103695]
MRGLRGKVVVVTGAAGGIGAATVRRLAEEGAQVVAVDLDERVSELPGAALAVRADVSAEDGVDAYAAAAVERFGRIDLHHLNAGIPGSFATLPTLSVAEFDKVMAVNVRGVFLGVRAAFRQYAAQGSHGNVVITGSIGSLRGSADLLAYQTSKHAVLGILRGAAMYGGPLGVRVNAVAPGIVPTDLFAANAIRGGGTAAGGKDDMSRRASSTPLRRAGTGDDVAGVVAFLLSDDAAYMTGEVVSVDGGASIVSTVRPSGGAGAWDFEAYDRGLYG